MTEPLGSVVQTRQEAASVKDAATKAAWDVLIGVPMDAPDFIDRRTMREDAAESAVAAVAAVVLAEAERRIEALSLAEKVPCEPPSEFALVLPCSPAEARDRCLAALRALADEWSQS